MICVFTVWGHHCEGLVLPSLGRLQSCELLFATLETQARHGS